MKKNIKLNIEVELSSEDENKLERTLMGLISKTTLLVKKDVNRKNKSLSENSVDVDYKYNTWVERK